MWIQFGLVGRKLGHSFSASYFNSLFSKWGLKAGYANYELETLNTFPRLLQETQGLLGLNVTTPYKESILSYIPYHSVEVKAIGAANTLVKTQEGQWRAHNTDADGLAEALKAWGHTPMAGESALILGTGGAARAVKWLLSTQFGLTQIDEVARTQGKAQFTYADIDAKCLQAYNWIFQCTPVGMYPDVDGMLPLPIEALHAEQRVVDLIYNPAETEFLRRARLAGAATLNGLEMLHRQAEAAWTIWLNHWPDEALPHPPQRASPQNS